MKGTPRTLVAVLLCAACQASAPQLDSPRGHRSSPPSTSCKPEPPVAVEITTRSLAADELEITARAIPTANVPAVELALALPGHATALGATHARYGATAAGQPQVMTTRIRVDQRTASVTAIARVTVDDVAMSRTATVAIGAPEPAPRTRTYVGPDGELAREVTP